MIRTQEQAPAIEKLGIGLPGKLNVLVSSVAEVSTQDRAATILRHVKPDYVAWSAGRHSLTDFPGRGAAANCFHLRIQALAARAAPRR